MKKPSIAELLQASGYATYPPELVQRAMSALYGNIGANLDARNWASILHSAFCFLLSAEIVNTFLERV